MNWQAWLTLAVAAATITALARDLMRPVSAVMGAMLVLLVAGVVTPTQAFAGFGNPAPMTVAALYILARAVDKTGLLNPLVYGLMGQGGAGRRTLARLVIPAAVASAFFNNTPIVAMLIPVILTWCKRHQETPGNYLMPMSFGVILGGVATTIGTSTNLVVSGLLEQAGQQPLGVFEVSPVGVPVAVVGLTLLLITSRWLLASRPPVVRESIEENVREFMIDMAVVSDGPLAGKQVEAAGLRNLQGVFLLRIEREGESIAPVSPETVLRSRDRLSFVGQVDMVLDLQKIRGLESAERRQVTHFDTTRHGFFEAVVGSASPLVGRTIKEAEFRRRYQAAVVAIHRAGERIRAKLGEVRLKVGDTLLVLTDQDFHGRWRDRGDFLLIASLEGTPPGVKKKAGLVGAIALVMVVVAGMGLLPVLQASLVAVAALVVSGVLTAGEAQRAVDLDVIILIAASFALGTAIDESGLAAIVARGVVGGFGQFGPTAVLFGVVLATVMLTELITNNAAVVLMFPIAVAAAQQVGVEPRAFAIAMAVAASNSFLTPIGYQTNTMVYGPGGYRFGDYFRLGFPLTIASVVLTVLIVSRSL